MLEAPHGEEAMRIVGGYTCAVHLLLTDVVVPQMSGRELAEHVTASHPYAGALYVGLHG